MTILNAAREVQVRCLSNAAAAERLAWAARGDEDVAVR